MRVLPVNVTKPACWLLLLISPVAAPCSSIAEAMVVVTSSIAPIFSRILLLAVTASSVVDWISEICEAICSVALAVYVARSLTAGATTAKPLPASPAPAASMVALCASRLV